jgi:ketosteroid isomerase-like protein
VSEADDRSTLVDQITSELELGPGTTLEGRQMIDLIEGVLRESAHPDYETVMVAKDGQSQSHPGVDGFREAIDDWLSPWAEFRFEIEELIPVDDMIVMMVRQAGTTKHGGVEIATDSGTIWWIVDGTIRRAAFYLDRDDARKVAGIG